jgi:hypothetical protein
VIEKLHQHVEKPLGLAWLDINDLRRVGALDGMRCKVADVANCVDVVRL